jgi:hypothetical protein
LIILQLALCLLHSAFPATAGDALWQQAVVISAYNRDFVPGNWIEREEVFNVEGASHLVSRTHVSFKQIGSTVDIRLADATSNGINITVQLRENFKEIRSQFSMKPQHNPFRPTNQKSVSAKRDGRTRRDGEQILVAYDYTQKTDNGRWRGAAWIDEATGMPTELTAQLTGLPAMDVKDEIHEKVLNVHFKSGPESLWNATKIVLFTRATLSNFPYSKFYGTIEKAITLDSHWKISFQ